MEITKVSTLSVPEISINAEPSEAIPKYCWCSHLRRNRSLEADTNVMTKSDSPTAMRSFAFESPSLERNFLCQFQNLGQHQIEKGTASKEENLSAGHISINVIRFFRQAAIFFSSGCISANIIDSTPTSKETFPHGILTKWLRAIADNDISLPIVDFEEIINKDSSSNMEKFKSQENKNHVAELATKGSLPGYVRIPREKVHVATYSEPDELDLVISKLKVKSAVEKFYGPANANPEKT